jgi:hypothetical protein
MRHYREGKQDFMTKEILSNTWSTTLIHTNDRLPNEVTGNRVLTHFECVEVDVSGCKWMFLNGTV